MVSATSGWSGMRTSPSRFSWHATWSGKTAASRSSERMRRIGGGTLRPPEKRSTASARDAFQRQRAPNIGAGSIACVSTSSTVSGCRKRKTTSSGKLCCSASEITMPLSVAAACSSTLKLRQKRLRSARPQARLMRAPSGACSTSCMPPPSSKKRSATSVRPDGTAPSAAAPART